MDKYNLCIAKTKKIVTSSSNLSSLREEKTMLEKLAKINNEEQEYLIYTDKGDLII